jgi:molybdopterin synthase sulfur carrier subunit
MRHDDVPKLADADRAAASTGELAGRRLVRFYAAAREAAGVSEVKVTARTIGELSKVLTEEYGPRLGRVLAVSSLLSEGEIVRVDSAPQTMLPGDGPVDVLPPFAGG